MTTMPTLPAGSRPNGFTLLELLIVMAIVGLTIVAVTPFVMQRTPGFEFRSAASMVTEALREARGAAIRNNREETVTFDLNEMTVRAGRSGMTQALSPGIGVTLRTATVELEGRGVGNIRFYPDGTSTGGRVIMSSEERKATISVDWLTGRVALRD